MYLYLFYVINTVEITHRRVTYNHSNINQMTNRLGITGDCHNRSVNDRNCRTNYYCNRPVSNRSY